MRGFFEDRGYYGLDELTAVDYRSGALAGKYREPIRIWLQADLVFEPVPRPTTAEPGESAADADEQEVLSAAGRTRLDRAMAEVLRYPRSSPLIVEGFAIGGPRPECQKILALWPIEPTKFVPFNACQVPGRWVSLRYHLSARGDAQP